MPLYFNLALCNTVAAAISKYGEKEFQSPTRSTVPLLSWLKHEEPMVDSLLRELGMPAGWDLHLEYKVKPPKGRGGASHTDLMVISGASSLAVEVKWTEPRYETVGKWLAVGSNTQNRKDVLAGWLCLLQKHAQRALSPDDFSNAVYQMVHRAAAACEAGKDPRLAYLVFEPLPDAKAAGVSKLSEDLAHLWGLMGGPSRFPFYLVEVHLLRNSAFEAIASLSKGHQTTAQQVAAALSGRDRLFSFEKYCVTRVE